MRNNGCRVKSYEENNKRIDELGIIQTALRTIWSHESYRRLRQELSKTRYDIMHVQNFFPLISPAAYYAARAEGVPVVQTLHNYRLLCPNSLFFRGGQVCNECLGGILPWFGVLYGCYRDSRTATATVAAMLVVHRIAGTWREMVDVYVALTEFARRKFIEGGLPEDRILVKPNFVYPDFGPGAGRGGFALFAGRLSEEKGIKTMLSAWEKLGAAMPLKLVGDGPLVKDVQNAVERLVGVEYLGRRPIEEVYALMGEASVLIFPSKCYEGLPRVIIEAFSRGTPVIASRLGAVGDIVEHGRTGYLFSPGDSGDLAKKVEMVLMYPKEMAQMRREARAEFEAKYTAEKNYEILMDIYRAAVERAGKRC